MHIKINGSLFYIEMSNYTYACNICRIARKGHSDLCAKGHTMKSMGKHWRAPKKNNRKAWQRVASGDALWDDRCKQRSAALKKRKRDKAFARWTEYCGTKKKVLDRLYEIE